MKLKLYYFPGACSRVTLTALEHIGYPYEAEVVNLAAGEQKQTSYLATNPRGKVPALLVDGKLLTENGAILTWLDATFPEANLLPRTGNAWEKAEQLSDLFWISAGWHPSVRANMAPTRWTVGDVEPVRARGKELMAPLIDHLEARLAGQPWYYGTTWSIIDMYLYWCYTTAENGQFSLEGRTNIALHRAAMEEHPALIAAKDREKLAKIREI